MEKVALSENELAIRWGVSPKTLQRWRSEGCGPRYLKLSKRVAYPLEEILTFESKALHSSTWQRASDITSPTGGGRRRYQFADLSVLQQESSGRGWHSLLARQLISTIQLAGGHELGAPLVC